MRMKISILLGFSLMLSFTSKAQERVQWSQLEDVRFVEYFDRDREEWSLEANYPDNIEALHQREIRITGYIIPLDVSGQVYALSAFAFSSCFFCGGAGPETVMGITFAEAPPILHTDDVVEITGTLLIARRPGMEFHYTMSNAKIVKRY